MLSLLREKNNITFHHKVPAYNEGKPQLHLSSWSFWQAQLQLQPIFLWVGQKKSIPKNNVIEVWRKNCTTSTLFFPFQHKKTSLLHKTDQKHEKTQLHNYFDKNNTAKSHARNWVFKFEVWIFKIFKFEQWGARNVLPTARTSCFRLPAQSPLKQWCV